MICLKEKNLLETFENLYHKYNRREYVSPDPLQFLYSYENFSDIEIVGIIASSLAYGNVKTILKSIDKILCLMNNPTEYVKRTSLKQMKKDFKDFKHRFTTGEEISNLLYSVKTIYDSHGSMHELFLKIFNEKNNYQSITETVEIFFGKFFKGCPTLIPDPHKGSACKRIHLFLRWMIRKDNVDLGLWDKIEPSALIIPLDTHMLKISKLIKLTTRNNGSLKTAYEITENFKKLNPKDPVKYDFVLTRFGIRKMPIDFISKK